MQRCSTLLSDNYVSYPLLEITAMLLKLTLYFLNYSFNFLCTFCDIFTKSLDVLDGIWCGRTNIFCFIANQVMFMSFMLSVIFAKNAHQRITLAAIFCTCKLNNSCIMIWTNCSLWGLFRQWYSFVFSQGLSSVSYLATRITQMTSTNCTINRSQMFLVFITFHIGLLFSFVVSNWWCMRYLETFQQF